MKPILAFYMGYSNLLMDRIIIKNVYGNEINALKLAEALSNIYNVYIFVNMNEKDELVYNNVTYLNIYKLNNLKKLI